MIISVFDRVENIVGKEEIAHTSNLPFSHNVFKRLLSQTCEKVSLCGNGLIATFQLSSAASLNLAKSQNGVLGNGFNKEKELKKPSFINSFQHIPVVLGEISDWSRLKASSDDKIYTASKVKHHNFG